MNISLNPSYLCNFRCSQCYLGENNLKDKRYLDLTKLDKVLSYISQYREISHVDLYGGEIALLSYPYLKELEDVIKSYYKEKINVITNFSIINDFFYHDNVEISVSFDYKYRQSYNKVISNIIQFPKNIHILVLAIDKIIKNADNDVIIMNQLFSSITNIVSVEIKPYSSNQYNKQKYSFLDYEDYIKKWISIPKKFEFINETNIKQCLNKNKSSFSDDHLYITPDGSLSVLEFDKNQNEYFKLINTFEEYIDWSNREKKMIYDNKYCKSCKYLGNCLSEHLQDVQTLEYGCNGFKTLLEYYENLEI